MATAAQAEWVLPVDCADVRRFVGQQIGVRTEAGVVTAVLVDVSARCATSAWVVIDDEDTFVPFDALRIRR